MFDKAAYWKRRKEGERGQEPIASIVLGRSQINHGKPGTRKQRRAAWASHRGEQHA